jgi:7,8-dihydropterin-6-yl-methyl-4-(beta-D-ribofuranosyl)aminobenzene 5'-phosphate synthase
MKVTSLVENTSCHANCNAIHGLSLDVETPQHHILFDMGPNALFLENAAVLGVDVAAADLAFLSHGHYDHGGGLELFCKRNRDAVIFVSPHAFGSYAARDGDAYENIGLEPHVQEKYRNRFQNFTGRWDEELFLFDDVTGGEFATAASASLLEKTQEGYQSDRFLHEQNLIVSCEGKNYLFAGCAHRGIVNILRAAEEHLGREMDYVISGFHLTNPGLGIDEPTALIQAVGEELKKRTKTRYITGHCTGDGPYGILKEILEDRLDTMPAGRTFQL